MKNNFGIDIELPYPSSYGPRASISYPNVFKDYDRVIKKHGYQLSFIDTQSDEYVIFVSKVDDSKKVIQAVNKIGYRFLHAHSPQVN